MPTAARSGPWARVWDVRDAGICKCGAQLLERALHAAAASESARTWAFTLVGIGDYLKCFSGDRHVDQVRQSLTQRLLDGFVQHSTDGWLWFEPELTYANATLPHALLVSGQTASHP